MIRQQTILNEVLNSNSIKRNSLLQKVLEVPFPPIETIEERHSYLNSNLNNYGNIIKTKLKQEIDIISKKDKAFDSNKDNKAKNLNDKVNNIEKHISSDKKRNSMIVMSENLKILDSLNNLKKKIQTKNDFFSYDNNQIITKESSKKKENVIKSINNKLQSKFNNNNNDDRIEADTKSNNEFTPVSCFKKTKTNKKLVIKEEFLLNNNTDKRSITPKIKKSTCSLVLDLQQDDIKFSYVNYSSKKQITCKDILNCLESNKLPHKRRSQTVNKIIILNDSKDSCYDSRMDFERVISKLYLSKKNNSSSMNNIDKKFLQLNVDNSKDIIDNNNNSDKIVIENGIKKISGHNSTADFKITEFNQLNSQTKQINGTNKNNIQKTLYLKNDDEVHNNHNNNNNNHILSHKDSYSFNVKKNFESSSNLLRKDIVCSKTYNQIDANKEKDKEINENKSKFKIKTQTETEECKIPLSTNFETLPNEQNNNFDNKKITGTARYLQKDQEDNIIKAQSKDIHTNKKIIVNSKSINVPYIYSHRNSESGSIDIQDINNIHPNSNIKDVIYLDTNKNNINIFNNIKNNIHHSSRPSEKNANKKNHKSCHCGCVIF